jgi:esterase/lipase
MTKKNISIRRELIHTADCKIPAIIIEPAEYIGAAVITHGYGGCKEELSGLAWRLSEFGIITCTIDLRGHGENRQPLDEKVHTDVESAVNYMQQYGKVIAIGHSLGGRLSLISSANFAIGISPALTTSYSQQTEDMINNMRGYRVKESSKGILFKNLKNIPEWTENDLKKVLFIYGLRDNPDIITSCKSLQKKGLPVIEINNAFHSDIFTVEETIKTVNEQVKKWFYNE